MASVQLVTDGSVLQDIPLKMLQHAGADHCDSWVKSCNEIFGSPDRNCISMLLQVFPEEKIYYS
jgi:hypothetical protein